MQTPIQKFIEWYNDPSGLYFPSEVQDKLQSLLHYEQGCYFDMFTAGQQNVFEIVKTELGFEFPKTEKEFFDVVKNGELNEDAADYFVKTYGEVKSDFDAKKVAEEMVEKFYTKQLEVLDKMDLGSCPIHETELEIAKKQVEISLQYSQFTQSQRQGILKELEKL